MAMRMGAQANSEFKQLLPLFSRLPFTCFFGLMQKARVVATPCSISMNTEIEAFASILIPELKDVSQRVYIAFFCAAND